MKDTRVLVTGAGGFIGQHLVSFLVDAGYWVRGADIKLPEFAATAATAFELLDLRRSDDCARAVTGIDWIFHLAANMGGIGFIESHKAEIVRDNTFIDLNMLEASRAAGVKKFLYASSACVYPAYLQKHADVTPLKESDAMPADPEDGYGWEKLYIERACRHYREDFGLPTYCARFHNIYGPLGTYDGGREKSPAAICRKLALADDGDAIEVWGDGEQTRSYCYVGDCVTALHQLIHTEHHDPINLGQDRMVSINELVDIVSAIAGKRVQKNHNLSRPQGVRGRNSDNSQLERVLGWAPRVTLEEGLAKTYAWIAKEVRRTSRTDEHSDIR